MVRLLASTTYYYRAAALQWSHVFSDMVRGELIRT